MNRAVAFVRSLLIWLVALPVLGILCVLIILLSLVHRGQGLDAMMKASSRIVLFVCGVRVRARGAEAVPRGWQFVVMMNHVNFFDPLVLYSRFPGLARGVEEEGHFRWPVYGWMLRRIGMIPISRKDTAKARESLDKAAALVRERPQYSIGILPEGTRTLDGELGPFKKGGFHLALATGLDILPVVQKGARRINRKGSLLIRPGTVELVYLPPVPVAGCGPGDVSAVAERTRRVFLEELEVAGTGAVVPPAVPAP
jgi:1-acyl-sn-glycerol-3-phosphate acyltransferase